MDFLHRYTSLIEKGLQNLEIPEKPESLYSPQKYILSTGGKRMRPALTLISCGLCGGKIENALPAALSVELIHNFTLIHDDIMDQAESRRGNPAVHTKWNQSTAILAGDGMFVKALQQLEFLPDSIDYKKISSILLEAVNTVCEGQAYDIEFEDRQDVTSEEYLSMIDGKTGALISAALVIGGMTAGGTREQLGALDVIGHSLGLAFQIQDDWLDVVADPEKFGKKKAGDICEGKKTYLMLSTLECCTQPERQWLLTCISDRPVQSDDIEKIIDLYNKYGVIEDSKARMQQYYQQAGKELEKFKKSEYQQEFSNLIKYLNNREY